MKANDQGFDKVKEAFAANVKVNVLYVTTPPAVECFYTRNDADAFARAKKNNVQVIEITRAQFEEVAATMAEQEEIADAPEAEAEAEEAKAADEKPEAEKEKKVK